MTDTNFNPYKMTFNRIASGWGRCLALAMLLFALAGSTQAQTGAERLAQMHELFQQQPDFRMDVDIQIFFEGTVGVQEMKGSVRSHKGQYYARIGQWENLMNDRCVLMVDHDQKTLMYLPPGKKGKHADPGTDPIALAEALKEASVETFTGADGKTWLRVPGGSGPVESTELLLGNDGRLLQLVHHYSASEEEGPTRVEVTYSNLEFDVPFDRDAFSEKAFVQGSGQRARPSETYSSYQLFNQYAP